MLDNRRVLAVVPARGGSKGLPGKNLKPFRGVPLVALAGYVAREVSEIDKAVVSTDSAEIALVAKHAGLEVPFMRPPELSGDLVGDVDVLVHALTATERVDGCRYDVVVMLQPTCPLRSSGDVRACLDMFAANDADSVWSVSATDKKYHPLKQLKVERSRLSYYDARGAEIIARQQLSDSFIRNGVAYVISRDCLMNRRSLMGERAFACITPGPQISVDTAEDLAAAEALAKAGTATP